MKRVTIGRALKKRGWCDAGNGNWMIDTVPRRRLFARLDGSGRLLKVYDGRLTTHPNVHIESYWSVGSLKELAGALDAIEQVYASLCGTSFRVKGD